MWSKMNVLHMHLTDSQSFSFETPRRPEVYQAGAFSAAEFYSTQDLSDIVQYGIARGVRIVPETDTPGHARAYGLSDKYSDIIACGSTDGNTWGLFCAEPPCGQLNPASTNIYAVLRDVLADINDVFQDDVVHLGFDEINFACWFVSSSVHENTWGKMQGR